MFWLLAAIAIGGGVGTISAQSPIYSAMWFALSLLGVASLFLQQDAQFLGIATMIVYAGAIVVTFLFVLMLAQPEGHSTADRISWGVLPKIAGVIVAGALVGAVAHVIHSPSTTLRNQIAKEFPEIGHRLTLATESQPHGGDKGVLYLFVRGNAELGVDEQEILEAVYPNVAGAMRVEIVKPQNDVQTPDHMATLGGQLFSRHLIAVELAGTLLLAALVGAVGMVIQGRLAKEGARDE
jgi:NADH-quinone oxidoreductase subunit J